MNVPSVAGGYAPVQSYNRIPVSPVIAFPHLAASLTNYALQTRHTTDTPDDSNIPVVGFVAPFDDFWKHGDTPPTHNQLGYIKALARRQGIRLSFSPTSKRSADRLIKRLQCAGGIK
jgi:hypothetical protein